MRPIFLALSLPPFLLLSRLRSTIGLAFTSAETSAVHWRISASITTLAELVGVRTEVVLSEVHRQATIGNLAHSCLASKAILTGQT